LFATWLTNILHHIGPLSPDYMTKQQKTEHVVSQPLLCDHLFDLLTRKCVSYRDIREKNAKYETHYHYLQS